MGLSDCGRDPLSHRCCSRLGNFVRLVAFVGRASARESVSMPQDGHQGWVILENIGRFEKRLASETRRDQREILEKLLA